MKKHYIKAAVNLRVDEASIGANRWRDPPSTLLLDPAESLGLNLQIHLNNDASKFE
jgi:hypothetical protein